ncbi:MAG: SDR family NAD(P)-dependent oxidoreductase [Christensenellales bacterium]|jgi:3-oxoacyl-[acyl-carrier protein] reductase
MQLKDRVCVITGAASGIGREIAITYAKEGAKVAIVDIQKEKAEETAKETNGRAYVCNLRSVPEIEATMAAIKEDFGRVDVLVNVAGLANRTPIEEITEEEWDLLNDVNLKATFFMSKEAYKIMLEQGSGKIINFASHRARTSDGRHTIYDATKAGVEALTRSFAVAGGPKGIVTNTIVPAYVITPMTAHNLKKEGWLDHMKQRIPLGRLFEMQEVANIALFLASDNSSGINGQPIILDGGWTIHE